jgi:type II secretory pathway component HofQ
VDLSLVRIASLALAVLLCAPLVHAERATHVYKAKHRVAQELLPVAQAGLGDAGSAVVDKGTNSLVLIGDPVAIEAALALLAAQDRRQRSIVLRYESRALSELEASGVRVEWSVRSGSVRVGNARLPGGASGLALRLRERSARETGSFSGQLRLLDGGSGRISAGTQVPVQVRRRGRDTTELIRAESGFEARARVLGDGRVRVQLSPFEAELGAGRSLDYTAAETEVELASGETVVIGELARETSAESDSPASRDDAEAREERVLLLTATLE